MFATGLYLSAFFSGSETGFYRLSIPRLNIDAAAGERSATRLMWFAQNPAYFVATCLIGNNVANYVTTAAISWWILLFFGYTNEGLEIGATLLLAPIIFQFAELLPKSVYYHAPFNRLKRNITLFVCFFRGFFLLSWPLVTFTRLFEKLSRQSTQPSEIVLGRNRLTQLMQHGHEEGVLTDIQSRLANGLLQLAPQPAISTMIPSHRVLGVSEDATPGMIIEFARKYAVSTVSIHKSNNQTHWTGYVLVADLLCSKHEELRIHEMPKLSRKASKLEALHLLQLQNAQQGAFVDGEEVLGIIFKQGLVEQIFRPGAPKRPVSK